MYEELVPLALRFSLFAFHSLDLAHVLLLGGRDTKSSGLRGCIVFEEGRRLGGEAFAFAVHFSQGLGRGDGDEHAAGHVWGGRSCARLESNRLVFDVIDRHEFDRASHRATSGLGLGSGFTISFEEGALVGKIPDLQTLPLGPRYGGDWWCGRLGRDTGYFRVRTLEGGGVAEVCNID